MQIWVNLATLGPNEQVLVEKFDNAGNNGGWSLYEQPGGGLQFFALASPYYLLTAPTGTLTAGAWHEIVVRRIGNQFEMFCDDQSVASSTSSVTIPSTAMPLLIGRRADPDTVSNVDGSISDVAIWNRALSNQELTGVYDDALSAAQGGGSASPPPNSDGVQVLGDGNTVGGLTVGARNVISGNAADGVLIEGNENTIEGNYIGTDRTGASKLANNAAGVNLADMAIGDTVSGNLISGNAGDGVTINGQNAPAGLVSYWPADGTSNDVAAGGNNGSGVGAVPSVPGKVGLAFQFGGSTDRVDVGDQENLQLQNFTISAWVKRANTTDASQFGDSGQIFGGGIGAYELEMFADGRIALAKAGSDFVASTGTISDTDWHQVAVSMNNGQVIFYIDGAPEAAQTYNTTLTFTGGDFSIGEASYEHPGSENEFDGAIDEMRLYDSPLSTAAVAQLANLTGDTIVGNFIGTNAAGTAALGNAGNGVGVYGRYDNTIGGTTAADGNVISGNLQSGVAISGSLSAGNTVSGNLIGTDITGKAALGNGYDGVYLAGGGNIIGGTTPALRNVVSGNQNDGIEVLGSGSGNVVQGNFIGTDVSGESALGNSVNGVQLDSAVTANLIGTDGDGVNDAAEANIISGNAQYGVDSSGGFSNTIAGNFIGTDATGRNLVKTFVPGDPSPQWAGNRVGGVYINGTGFVPGYGYQVGVNNVIGGPAAADRNVISGNIDYQTGAQSLSTAGVTLDNPFAQTIEGNYIGTDVTGNFAVGNGYGIVISAGTDNGPIAGNVISGNALDGVRFDDFGGELTGNYVGINAAGTSALPNQGNGITVNNGSVVIGDPNAGDDNVVSGNMGAGIVISGSGGGSVNDNLIGSDVTGDIAVPNGGPGVELVDSSAAVGNNEISGNAGDGIQVIGNAPVPSGNPFGASDRWPGNDNTDDVVGGLNGTTIDDVTYAPGHSGDAFNFDGSSSVQVPDHSFSGPQGPDGEPVLEPDAGLGVSAWVMARTAGTNPPAVVSKYDASDGVVSYAILGPDASGEFTFEIGLDDGSVLSLSSPPVADVLRAFHEVAMTWDGTTLAGYIDGKSVGSASDNSGAGVRYDASPLVIGNGFDGLIEDVQLYADNPLSASQIAEQYTGVAGNSITSNYIGVNDSGTAVLANGADGIELDGASNNTIGDMNAGPAGAPGSQGAPGLGNLISGNHGAGVYIDSASTFNTVDGNYIGTDPTAATAFPNQGDGVYVAGASNTIGGTTASGGNLISGNAHDGVAISGAAAINDTVSGNYIGTNTAGTGALANGTNGVELDGTSNNIIGGTNTNSATLAGSGNLIAGNAADGVYIDAGSSSNAVSGNYIGAYAASPAPLSVTVYPANNGFELPDLTGTSGDPSDAYEYGPAGAAWIFASSGIAANGSNFNVVGAQNGNSRGAISNSRGAISTFGQAAFIQGGDGTTTSGNAAYISQTLVLQAGSASVSFSLEQRLSAASFGGNNPIDVKLDNIDLGTYLATGSSSFDDITTPTVQISAGTHTLYFIGTDPSGGDNTQFVDNVSVNMTIIPAALSQGANGIAIAGAHNTVGGTTAAARNVISGNAQNGVLLTGTGATGNLVEGNYVGTDITGTAALGNVTNGVEIAGASNNVIGGVDTNSGGTLGGAGNLISGNTGDGICVDTSSSGNTISGDYIGTSVTGAVALGNHDGLVVAGTNNTVGGGNTISGNRGTGVVVEGSSNTIAGNSVGTDVTGTVALGNAIYGVWITDQSTGNVVGGMTAAASNVISGNNSDGIHLDGTTSSTTIVGNYIGTDITGAAALANTANGVYVAGANNTIGGTTTGAANTIAFNAAAGVAVTRTSAIGNAIRANRIFANGKLGIDLGGSSTPVANDSLGHSGPNDFEDFPLIGAVASSVNGGTPTTAFSGTLNAAANTTYSIDFFSNPASDPTKYGQGQTYLGSTTVSTDASGAASFDVAFSYNGTPANNGGQQQAFSATATDAAGNTSEFGPDYPTPNIVVAIGAPATAGEAETIQLISTVADANAGGVNGGVALNYNWTVTTPTGSTLSLGPDATQPTLTLDPLNAGTYTVTLTVTDSEGAAGQATATIGVSAPVPTVVIQSQPTTTGGPPGPAPGVGTVGTPVNLQGAILLPSDDTIDSYRWSVTDGSGRVVASSTSALFSFTPAAAGNYSMTLGATDAAGYSANAIDALLVTSNTPVAAITGLPAAAIEGTPISLANTITSDSFSSVMAYVWTVTKDGTLYDPGTPTDRADFTFTPDDEGSYVVSLNVIGSGASGVAPPVTIVVGEAPLSVAIANPPVAAQAGTAINLTESGGTPNTIDDQTTTLTWSVSGGPYTGGSPATGGSFSFTPTAPGFYIVTLTATDMGATVGGQHPTASSYTAIAVTAPPVAVITGAPATSPEGTPLSLANLVTPGSLTSALSYAWSVMKTGDPSFALPPNVATNEATFDLTPNDEGSYVVNLSVSDGTTTVVAPAVTINVVDSPLTAAITGAPTGSVLQGTPINLAGAAGTPGTLDAPALAWSVTDNGQPYALPSGTATNAATFNFTPPTAGIYTITLQATDGIASAIASVEVNVVSPVIDVSLTPPANALEGAGATVTATVQNPLAGQTYTYAWSVTNESDPVAVNGTANGDGSSFTFSPPTPGAYLVSVMVADQEASVTTSTVVQAGNQPPTAPTISVAGGGADITASPAVGEGVIVTFSATSSDPGGSYDTLSYGWTVAGPEGFAQSASGAAFSFTPLESGQYVVTSTVTDANGATASSQTTLTVTHVTPTPTIEVLPDTRLNGAGQLFVDLTARVPDPGDDDQFAFAWAVTDPNGQPVTNVAASGPELSFTETTSGTYTVSSTVTDDDDGIGTTTTPILTYQNTSVFLSPPADPHVTQVTAIALGNASVDASGLSAPVVLAALGEHDTLVGGSGPNVLEGDSGFNLLLGGSGPNTLYGSAGDTLFGGTGANTNLFNVLTNGQTQDGPNPPPYPLLTVNAGATQNTLSFAASSVPVNVDLTSTTTQTIDGSQDQLLLSGSFQSLVGSAGADRLFAAANSTVYGGGGNDTLLASGSNIALVSGSLAGQAAQLEADGGANIQLFGGAGNDVMSSTGGSGVSMYGGGGNDSLTATGGTTLMMTAGDGNDSLYSSGGAGVTIFGGSGDDVLGSSGGANVSMYGGSGNDTLTSTGDTTSTMAGGSGNDSLYSSGGSGVTIFGGSGNDVLSNSGGANISMYGGAGSESLVTSGGTTSSLLSGANDSLYSSGGSNVTIFGGSGDDLLGTSGGAGVSMYGGSGNDTLTSTGDTASTMVGGTGGDSLYSNGGSSVTIFGGSGNDLLGSSGGAGVSMYGGSGNDTLTSTGDTASTMVGGSGNDSLYSSGGSGVTIFGGSGNDVLGNSGGANISMYGGSGSESLVTSGGTTNTLLSGANDSLYSSGGSNVTIFGGSGSDVLGSSGGAGVSMYGGTGNDTLTSTGDTTSTMVAGSGNDSLYSSGGSGVTIFGGNGNDVLGSSGGASVSMYGGSGNDTLTSTGDTASTMVGGSGNDSLYSSGGSGVTIFGGSGNDVLGNSGGANISMYGGSGSESLVTSGGTTSTLVSGANDSLYSGGGSNITIFGGSGNDVLGSSGGTAISMYGGSGNDTLTGTGDTTSTMVGGSGNDSLYSTGGSSVTIFGGSGDDVLGSSGGIGVSMYGGSGNDTLTSAGNTTSTVVGGTGGDSLYSSGGSSVTIFGGSGSDVLGSSGGTAISMYGGSGNDTLTSTGDTTSTMVGGTGNDSLYSSGGSSVTIFGGSGNDVLGNSGGANISMYGGAGSESLVTSGGTTSTVIAGGSDSLYSSGGSSVTIFGGSGNDLLGSSGGMAISMYGGSGNDTLTSTGGTSSTMVGGTGNDSLYSSSGSGVTIFGGSGNDVLGSSGGAGVSMYGGSGNDTLNDTGATSSSMVGGTGNDSLYSSGGSSVTIFGGTGNDVLSSGGGTGISMYGGTGNDTLVAGGSMATQGGTQTLYTSAGSGITLFGGSGNDVLGSSGGIGVSMYGGSGNDTLTSTGDTTSTMVGGTGNDSLYSSGGSSVTIFGGTGNDVLTDSGGTNISMYGGAGSESIVTSGGATSTVVAGGNDSLYTSGGSSVTIFGGTGNDVLGSSGGTAISMYGGSGNDALTGTGDTTSTMVGGTGNDSLYSSGGSSVTVFGGTGNDVLSSSSGTAISMYGGSGNDTLAGTGDTTSTMVGGSGNDSLYSSRGSSVTLFGGTGNDTLSNTGGTAISVYGGAGDDTLSNVGGTGNALVGGTGNDSLDSNGGLSTTLFGGNGNDTLASSGDSAISMIGGSGNDSLTTSGDTSATVIAGGTAGDVMFNDGGSSVTLFGGSGNDTLGTAGGSQIELAAGAGANVYTLSGSGDPVHPATVTLNDVDAYGTNQADSDAIVSGSNTIEFGPQVSGVTLNLGLAGNGAANEAVPVQQVTSDLSLSLVGQFQHVIGTSGNDSLVGGSGPSVLDGGGGNDTLVGGSGPATLAAGTGNDSLVAGTGGTTFQFAGSQFGSDTIDPPGGTDDTLDFSQFGGPVTLNLASTSSQVVNSATGLTLTFDANAVHAVNTLIDGDYNDSITGNAAGDRFFVGPGNDTFTGGDGGDTFYFAGSQLGSDQINETGVANSLNFLGLDAPVNVDLGGTGTGAQVTSTTDGKTNLSVTLSNPNAFDDVVGTAYDDTLQAGGGNVSLYGAGGDDSLLSGSGNDHIQAGETQVVYVDFNNPASATDLVYTSDEQSAILARVAHDFADFNYEFTTDQATAKAWAAPFGAEYTTVEINQGAAGGAADELDFGNIDLGGVSTVNINPFLGTAAGLVAPTETNIINLTADITAHELGHQSGLRHSDAFGPIGTGVYPTVASGYYPGEPSNSAGAPETPEDIMASPGSVGTTLNEAAQLNYFGARDDIKLAFNDNGAVVDQNDLNSAAAPPGRTTSDYVTKAYQLPALPQLAVPNTIEDPTNPDYGTTFNVTAIDVSGALSTANEQDFYAFDGAAGELMNFQAISHTDTLNPRPFFTELGLFDAAGDLLAYNLHDFESTDSSIVDFTLPATGTYYIGVDAYDGLPRNISPGDYQLFMYRFATTAPSSPAAGGGDTMQGGSGSDTFVGSSGNDVVNLAPSNFNPATIFGGWGQTVVNANGSVKPEIVGGNVQAQDFTTSPTITWATPADIAYGTPLSATQLDATANVPGTFAYSLPVGSVLGAGSQTLSVTFTPTDTADFTVATDSVTLVVDKATPTITWANPADIAYGTALSGTQLDASASWTVGGTLGSVAGTFTYSPAVGTVLGAGSQALSVTFTPTDATDYQSATASVTLVVDKATPTITWANPADITYGTALSGTQLDASSSWTVGGTLGSVAGTFAYTPAPGTVLGAGSQTLSVTFTPTDATDYDDATDSVTLVVNPSGSTTALAVSGPTANFYFGQTLTLTATVSPNSGTVTPGGAVDFVDTTTGVDLGTAALSSSGKSTVNVADLPVGKDAIQANYLGATGFNTSSAASSVSIDQSVIVLNATASAALGLSGNASLKFAAGLGLVEVDSSSSTALTVSGNAQVNAGSGLVQVVGGDSGKVSPKPATGAKAALADPLANLAAPAGGGSLGAVSVSGNSSKTINPGEYTQISVSGNAKLTLNPGTYIITGGGFSVSGNASVTGAGVMIFNAGGSFPKTGGSYGYVNLSGNGAISLTPQTTGADAGILIFQPRDNAQALTFSGNAMGGMSGTIYAPDAAATISGNASLNLPLIVNTLTVSGNAVFNDVASQPSAGGGATVFTPDQIRTAYGLDKVSSDGAGQTIAIVDAYDDPAIFDALDAFDSQFGLSGSGPNLNQQYGPASSFLTVLNENGQSSPLPATDPTGAGNDNWEVEEALDVEWAHATAPGARILLVEANSQSLDDLMSAVGAAAGLPGVSVVSMSWGFTEGQSVLAADEALYDGYLTTPAGHQGVTFVASTGDYGAANPEYPAFSPNVVAVGGTSLVLSADDSYNSETGWGSLDTGSGVFYGGGGGISLYEPEPAYQSGVQTLGNRTTPDVSFVADPGTGAWIADPYNLDPSNPWEVVGGTSLSAPAWAGLIAIANQARVAAGGATLGSATPNEAQDALYSVPPSDYHDITSGSNGYAAGAGYDLVTGLGTPVADKLVPDLAAFTLADPIVVESSPLTAAGAVPAGNGGNGESNAVQGPANALPIFAAEVVMPGAPAGQLTTAVGDALGSTRTNATLDAPMAASAAYAGAASGNVDGFRVAPRWALDEWDAALAAMVGIEEGDTRIPTRIDLMAWSAANGPSLATQAGLLGDGVQSSFEDGEFLDTVAQARAASADVISARVRTLVPKAARQVPAAIADAVFGQRFE